MHFKKIFAVLLIGCMLFSLAACGAKDRDVQSEHNALVAEETPQPSGETVAETPETTAPALPTATSEDVELYVVRPASSAPYVVNAYGQLARNYSVSDDGSIVDRAGNTVVVSGNTKNFTFVTTADFGSRTAEVTLNAREDISDTDKDVSRIHQYPVNLTLLLTIGPEAATNRTVVLGSSNAGIVEVRANNNAKILADGAFELEPGELAIDVGETGNARIVVTAKTEGVATITARSLSGTATAECIVTVKNGEIEATSGMPGYDPDAEISEMINASEDPTIHTHSYTSTVVEPTQYEKGYTLYTCECGHSYKDNFTSPLPMPEPEATPHVHDYSETVVAPTATERGYTLHVCHECGDSYKDCFTNPTG